MRGRVAVVEMKGRVGWRGRGARRGGEWGTGLGGECRRRCLSRRVVTSKAERRAA